jgi:hypothetical protein
MIVQRKLLSQLGGKVPAKGVKKMCDIVITNRLASEYTLLGKKKNRGNFSKLRLYRIMQRKCLFIVGNFAAECFY